MDGHSEGGNPILSQSSALPGACRSTLGVLVFFLGSSHSWPSRDSGAPACRNVGEEIAPAMVCMQRQPPHIDGSAQREDQGNACRINSDAASVNLVVASTRFRKVR